VLAHYLAKSETTLVNCRDISQLTVVNDANDSCERKMHLRSVTTRSFTLGVTSSRTSLTLSAVPTVQAHQRSYHWSQTYQSRATDQ